MMKIEIKTVRIPSGSFYWTSENYSQSGFFLIDNEEDPDGQNGSLVFYSNSTKCATFVCTKEEIDPFLINESNQEEKPKQELIVEDQGLIQKGFVSEEFALKLVELIVKKD